MQARLIAYPTTPVYAEVVDREPDERTRIKFASLCENLYKADWPSLFRTLFVDSPSKEPCAKFSDKAQEGFDCWQQEHMRMVTNDGTEVFRSKERGLLVRLALLLHLVAWSDGIEKEPARVSLDSLNSAITIVEQYCLPMWTRVVRALHQSAAETNAERVGNG